MTALLLVWLMLFVVGCLFAVLSGINRLDEQDAPPDQRLEPIRIDIDRRR
jgi:hypothetical protein